MHGPELSYMARARDAALCCILGSSLKTMPCSAKCGVNTLRKVFWSASATQRRCKGPGILLMSSYS